MLVQERISTSKKNKVIVMQAQIVNQNRGNTMIVMLVLTEKNREKKGETDTLHLLQRNDRLSFGRLGKNMTEKKAQMHTM